MANNTEKGFWGKTWGAISYPFRADGLSNDVMNSSLFPYKRAQDLMARPPKDLSAAENEELAKLMRQSTKTQEGIGGVASTVTERTVDGVVDTAKDIGSAIVKPITDKLKPFAAFTDFLKDNWKIIAAVVGAVAVTVSTGGILGTIALISAAVFIANELVHRSTGKSLLEHAGGLFSSKKDSVAVHAPAIQKQKEVAQTTSSVSEPLVPENPRAFPGEKPKWQEALQFKKPVEHKI